MVSSFKPKTDKKLKVNKEYLVTLDEKHQEKIKEFIYNNEVIIPKYKKEKHNLQKILDTGTETLQWADKFVILERIDEIKKMIKSLKNIEKNYKHDNAKYIFEYFNNKKNINDEQDKDKDKDKDNKINNFFKPNFIKNKNNATNPFHTNVVKNYLANIDDMYLDINQYVINADTCQTCLKGELIPNEEEGVIICDFCYKTSPCLIENEKPSYKDPPKEVSFYTYKRIHHFKEIIMQFTAKQTTQIPEQLIQAVLAQIKKERLTICEDDLPYEKMKDMLKNLGYYKYYEHIAYIKNILGIPPPDFSPMLKEQLYNLFMEIQLPYAETADDEKVNFYNYYHVMYKFLEMLGETQYLRYIPLLKDIEKINKFDLQWKKICKKKNYIYLPTIVDKTFYK